MMTSFNKGGRIGESSINLIGTLVDVRDLKKSSPLEAQSRSSDTVDPASLMTASEIHRGSDRTNHHIFIQKFIEHKYSLKAKKLGAGNRFCVFFVHILQQVTIISRKETSLINQQYRSELEDMELLLYRAIQCVNEPYDLFFDIARHAEFFIMSFLPQHESAVFFEALANSSAHRSKKQFGIMLACHGAVLKYNNSCKVEAWNHYQKSLVVLEPLGDSIELAWLYNHVGFTWFQKGIYKKAKRYYNDAKRMLQREARRLKLLELETIGSPKGDSALGREQRYGERVLSATFSVLGILHTTTDTPESAINHHEEALRIRQQLYGLHPTLGQGYNNLCLVYERAGNYKKAQECCRKGLHLKSMLVPRNSDTILVSLLNLSKLTLMYDGSANKALQLLDEAYNIREVLGLNHHSTPDIWLRRGNVYLNLEKYSDATVCFNKAVDGYLGVREYPRTLAEALFKLGIALKNTGNLIEAEQRLGRSLKVSQKFAKDNGTAEEEDENVKDALRELKEVKELAQSL